MRRTLWLATLTAAALLFTEVSFAAPVDDGSVPVTPDNFPRAESDLRFSIAVRDAGIGKFLHQRKPASLDKQTVPRAERDVLTSTAVFDLDAGPVTITLPDSAGRFLSMQTIDEDGYTDAMAYGAGSHLLSKEMLGTRYALVALRIAVDPNDPRDLAVANALQDAVKVDQPGGPGLFQIPNWDAQSQVDVRTGLRVLADTLRDTRGLTGARGKVDPVRRLIGSAIAWGAPPESDLMALNRTPDDNESAAVYRLDLKSVPVDGFWSVSVYNDRGFFSPNAANAYTLTNATARPNPDGGFTLQFGGCDQGAPNCLPTSPGWSLAARLYRPKADAVSGGWVFPKPTLVAEAPAPAAKPAPKADAIAPPDPENAREAQPPAPAKAPPKRQPKHKTERP